MFLPTGVVPDDDAYWLIDGVYDIPPGMTQIGKTGVVRGAKYPQSVLYGQRGSGHHRISIWTRCGPAGPRVPRREDAMKMIVVAAVMAAGIGLMGMTQTMAAPAGGVVIGQAVSAASPITSARCAWRCAHRRPCQAPCLPHATVRSGQH